MFEWWSAPVHQSDPLQCIAAQGCNSARPTPVGVAKARSCARQQLVMLNESWWFWPELKWPKFNFPALRWIIYHAMQVLLRSLTWVACILSLLIIETWKLSLVVFGHSWAKILLEAPMRRIKAESSVWQNNQAQSGCYLTASSVRLVKSTELSLDFLLINRTVCSVCG